MFTAIIIISLTLSLIIGISLILKIYFKFQQLERNGLNAKGVITDFEITQNRENKNIYFPIVQFKTFRGEEINGKPLSAIKEDKYFDNNKNVEIKYLEKNPNIFILTGQQFDKKLFLILSFFILGYPFTIYTLSEKNPD